MSQWLEQKIKLEHNRWINGLIRLSQMVEQGKLSNSSVRKVFSEFTDKHNQNVLRIKEVDLIWKDR